MRGGTRRADRGAASEARRARPPLVHEEQPSGARRAASGARRAPPAEGIRAAGCSSPKFGQDCPLSGARGLQGLFRIGPGLAARAFELLPELARDSAKLVRSAARWHMPVCFEKGRSDPAAHAFELVSELAKLGRRSAAAQRARDRPAARRATQRSPRGLSSGRSRSPWSRRRSPARRKSANLTMMGDVCACAT